MYNKSIQNPKHHQFPSVPSQYSKQSSSYNQPSYFNQNRPSRMDSQNQQRNQKSYQNRQMLVDLENLDIEPIYNITGDRFIIDETEESVNSSYLSKRHATRVNQVEFLESQVWVDVFYAKKSIIQLLQERTEVCEMYKLNSKSLKQINTNPNKRIYTDMEIAQNVKELFEESPSYGQYDHMCFTMIPQLGLFGQKYFVFMGADNMFVPQCKWCSLSAYLILNVDTKQKPQSSSQTLSIDKIKNSAIIKGKIICSNSKCKKKLLGEFVISQEDTRSRKGSMSRQNTFGSNDLNKQYLQKNNVLKGTFESQKKKQPQLSQRDKMMIKKAATKVSL